MSKPVPPAGAKPCPICRKPRSKEYAPFCSARCRDRDLGRWLSDGYALPGPPADPEDIVREDIIRED